MTAPDTPSLTRTVARAARTVMRETGCDYYTAVKTVRETAAAVCEQWEADGAGTPDWLLALNDAAYSHLTAQSSHAARTRGTGPVP